MRKTVLSFLVLFTMACSTRETETMAHITQRRHAADGKLVITYRFLAGDRIILDSVEVGNRIVPHDSVKVAFSPQNPGSSRLVLP